MEGRFTSLACAGMLLASFAATAVAGDAAGSAPAERHLALVGAARGLVDDVGERVWPGWGSEGFELLLIAGEREHLIGRRGVPVGFETAPESGTATGFPSRQRVFPRGMLATMALFGPPATIVIGTPEATELEDAEWILALVHEHFHQWQMRDGSYFGETEALNLAAGDTTGRWMLEYPFPYGDAEVGAGFESLARRLAALLRLPEADAREAAGDFWRRWAEWLAALDPADARYARFQLWQEGVARFVELRSAEEAAEGWSLPPALAARQDFEGFGPAARSARERVLRELEAPDLAGRRRVSFYAFGAGLALLLDRTEPGWKSRYERPRFVLGPVALD